MKKFSLSAIQKALIESQVDGWLFYDFMGNDPIGRTILGIDQCAVNTRRWFYYIPALGAPKKLVHGIENMTLNHLPGKKEIYISWKEMIEKLNRFFTEKDKIAIQYSPQNAIPTISKIDAGMYELLKSFKLNLISAGDLIQQFETCLSKAQINTHINVAGELNQISEKSFLYIKQKIQNHEEITELSLQNFLQNQLNSRGLFSEVPQVIATAEHTSDPSYIPTEESNKPIHDHALVQLSLRAKETNEDAVYGSTSWVIYIGEDIPDEYIRNFKILKSVRDKAVSFIRESLKSGKQICGWEVDDIATDIIKSKGLGGNYLHRTGRSLGKTFYGHGVNLDNLETRDDRQIIPGLCLSVAPGVYFSDYGLRTEINIYIEKKAVKQSTESVPNDIHHIKIRH